MLSLYVCYKRPKYSDEQWLVWEAVEHRRRCNQTIFIGTPFTCNNIYWLIGPTHNCWRYANDQDRKWDLCSWQWQVGLGTSTSQQLWSFNMIWSYINNINNNKPLIKPLMSNITLTKSIHTNYSNLLIPLPSPDDDCSGGDWRVCPLQWAGDRSHHQTVLSVGLRTHHTH